MEYSSGQIFSLNNYFIVQSDYSYNGSAKSNPKTPRLLFSWLIVKKLSQNNSPLSQLIICKLTLFLVYHVLLHWAIEKDVDTLLNDHNSWYIKTQGSFNIEFHIHSYRNSTNISLCVNHFESFITNVIADERSDLQWTF